MYIYILYLFCSCDILHVVTSVAVAPKLWYHLQSLPSCDIGCSRSPAVTSVTIAPKPRHQSQCNPSCDISCSRSPAVRHRSQLFPSRDIGCSRSQAATSVAVALKSWHRLQSLYRTKVCRFWLHLYTPRGCMWHKNPIYPIAQAWIPSAHNYALADAWML